MFGVRRRLETMADLRSDEFMNHALRDWEDMVYRLALSQPTQAMCARKRLSAC